MGSGISLNPFMQKSKKHSPHNVVEAFCYQIYDRLSIARSMAESGNTDGAFTQIGLIENDIALLKDHRELDQLEIAEELS